MCSNKQADDKIEFHVNCLWHEWNFWFNRRHEKKSFTSSLRRFYETEIPLRREILNFLYRRRRSIQVLSITFNQNQNFSNFSWASVMCGSWILIEFPAWRAELFSYSLSLMLSLSLFSTPLKENSFIFGKVIIYVRIEDEGKERKTFHHSTQQQEKLWAIKKDWIWLKSLPSPSSCVCLV